MGIDLKYDIDKINEIAKKFADKNQEITEASSNLKKTFEELKGQWNTEASKKFFETVDEDWKAGVDAASKVLTDLELALKDAAKEYALIENEARTKFKDN